MEVFMPRALRLSVAAAVFIVLAQGLHAIARPAWPAEAHRKGFTYINSCLDCHTDWKK
jgi:hypothetical protein